MGGFVSTLGQGVQEGLASAGAGTPGNPEEIIAGLKSQVTDSEKRVEATSLIDKEIN